MQLVQAKKKWERESWSRMQIFPSSTYYLAFTECRWCRSETIQSKIIRKPEKESTINEIWGLIFRDFQKSPHILKQVAADPKYPGTSPPPIRDGGLKVFETLCYKNSEELQLVEAKIKNVQDYFISEECYNFLNSSILFSFLSMAS
jgi:hypothetical protein